MTHKMNPEDCQNWIQEHIDIDFFRAISDPVRSELLIFLASSGEMTIGEIAENFPQNRSVISRHLDLLYRIGAVERNKEGREVYYRTSNTVIVDKFEQAAVNMRAVLNK